MNIYASSHRNFKQYKNKNKIYYYQLAKQKQFNFKLDEKLTLLKYKTTLWKKCKT